MFDLVLIIEVSRFLALLYCDLSDLWYLKFAGCMFGLAWLPVVSKNVHLYPWQFSNFTSIPQNIALNRNVYVPWV